MIFIARFGFALSPSYCGSFTTRNQRVCCELDALPWHCSSQTPFGQDWEKIFSLLQKACEGCREMAADSISELPTSAATRGEKSGMLQKKQTFAIGIILLGLMIEGRGKLE